MENVDLAGVEHCNGVYRAAGPAGAGWEPEDYDSLVLADALLSEIASARPLSLLEVGCGNTPWLPYLGRRTGLPVKGMDYSPAGCDLARDRLAAEGVEGEIVCADLFRVDPDVVGRHGFVFSLGLVEHFTDLEDVLGKLAALVRPGGSLFTEVPNLRSIHGALSWIWQPELFAKHRRIGRSRLAEAHRRVGLEHVRARYRGVFSLDIVAWETYPRWPRLAPIVAPRVRRLHGRIERLLRRTGWLGGTAPFAPFLYAVGRRPQAVGADRR